MSTRKRCVEIADCYLFLCETIIDCYSHYIGQLKSQIPFSESNLSTEIWFWIFLPWFLFNFQEFSIECLKPRICYLEFTALWMKAVIIYCNLVWVAIHARYILPFDWEIYDKDPNRRSMKSCIKKCMSYNANII